MSVLIQFLQNNNTESISETGFILAKSDHDTAVPLFYNSNSKSYHNYNVIVSSIQSVNLFVWAELVDYHYCEYQKAEEYKREEHNIVVQRATTN